MLQMGRRRQTRLDLPPRMQFKHGAYYHASSKAPRKWTRLHSDLNQARVLWAEIENVRPSDTPLVNDLIDRWLVSPHVKKLSANTMKAYESAARVLRVFFDNARLSAIITENACKPMNLLTIVLVNCLQKWIITCPVTRMAAWGAR